MFLMKFGQMLAIISSNFFLFLFFSSFSEMPVIHMLKSFHVVLQDSEALVHFPSTSFLFDIQI